MNFNWSKEQWYEKAAEEYENRNLSEAIRCFKLCIEAANKETPVDQPFLFKRSIEISQVLLESNLPKEVPPFIDTAFEVLQLQNNAILMLDESADYLELLGNFTFYFEQFDRAEFCYSYAESRYTDINSISLARAKKSLAGSRRGEIVEGVNELKSIIAIPDLNSVVKNKARKYLSDIMVHIGEYQQAIETYLDILQDQNPDPGGSALWLMEIKFNMATAYLELGNYATALTFYRQVNSEISFKNCPGGERLRMQALMMIAKISIIRRDTDEAILLLDEIDENSLPGSDLLLYHFIRAQLELSAWNEEEKSNTPYLDRILNYSVEEIKTGHDIEILILQGNILFRRGNVSASLAILEKLADHYRDKGDFEQSIRFRLHQYRVRIQSGSGFNKSALLSILDETEKSVKDYHESKSTFLNWMEIAELYCRLEEYEKARVCLLKVFDLEWELIRGFAMAGEREQIFYLDRIGLMLSLIYQTSLNLKETPSLLQQKYLDLHLKSKSLAHLNSRIFREIISRPDLKGKNTILVYRQKYKELHSRVFGNTRAYRALKMEVDYLEGKIKMETDYLQRIGNLVHISWQDVQKKMYSTDAAIVFSRYEQLNTSAEDRSGYLAHVILPEAVEPIVIDLEIKDHFLRELMPFHLVRDFEPGGIFLFDVERPLISNLKILYQHLFKPLEKHLQGFRKVWYTVDGLLNYVPFAALINEGDKYLADLCELHQLQDFRELNIPGKAMSIDSIALFGGMDFGRFQEGMGDDEKLGPGISDLAPIAESGQENSRISDLFARDKYAKYISNRLDLDIFRDMCRQNMPSCLHILTHGFFFNDEKRNYRFEDIYQYRPDDIRTHSNPLLRSGIFASGYNYISTTAEVKPNDTGVITSWDISRSELEHVSLVTIHACESALGPVRNGETYGLARAFRLAGVKAVILTLWQVQYTEFYVHFYRHLLENGGYNIREAFRHAVAEVKKEKPNPYWWGGFVLVE